ncbi:MAG TPA: hypothetical protein VK474_06160 [Chthoniobacterales bacterium]|nr:hypothetical protein [Chthoniobacterales bacterium]
MFSAVARGTLIAALCVSIGAHWAVLQSVAWATMIVDYSQRVPLSTAVAQTLSGKHPCNLCKGIAQAQHDQRKAAALPTTLKPDLICPARTTVPAAGWVELRFGSLQVSASLLAHSPPTPPPRSELA